MRIDEGAENATHREMMLNSDMCLLYTSNLDWRKCDRQYVKKHNKTAYDSDVRRMECRMNILD